MNIYLVSQTDNNKYDTFDSFVCYAENEYQAQRMTPSYHNPERYWNENGECTNQYSSWAFKLSNVTVEFIGTAEGKTPGIILESFNAG